MTTLDPGPATTPTAEEVFKASRLKWSKLGYPSASDLEDIRIGAAAYLVEMTGHYWSDWPAPTGFAGVMLTEPELIPLARVALRLRVEQEVLQGQVDYTDTANDDLISSMSVGGYSESRRDTATLRGGRYASKPMLNTNPGLNSLLEALMTEERYEFWLYRLQGSYPPDFQIEEVNWTLVGKSMLAGRVMSGDAPWTMWN